jgi:hypothetical protein
MSEEHGAEWAPAEAAAAGMDVSKFENVHQVGGIQTALLSSPNAGGSTAGTRVAHVDTGSGLRFTVALDRGGDIVEAFHNRHSLAYLSPVGLGPPSHAFHRDTQWLRNWAGGLLTTCGPQHIGRPRVEDEQQVSLHGRHSNTPAAVEMLLNPDPHRGRFEMLISMVIRDVQTFGPHLEVRRQIQCTLGQPQIIIHDQVTNRGNSSVAHNWLYHVNLGYPLLDEGAQFVYSGHRAQHWQRPQPPARPLSAQELEQLKRVPGPLAAHLGLGERGLIVEVQPDDDGQCHVGIVNAKLGLGLQLQYPADVLPRFANWQHFGPGSYVAGLEPFAGSLIGKDADSHPAADLRLEPGQSRRYRLVFRVLTSDAECRTLLDHDAALTL